MRKSHATEDLVARMKTIAAAPALPSLVVSSAAELHQANYTDATTSPQQPYNSKKKMPGMAGHF